MSKHASKTELGLISSDREFYLLKTDADINGTNIMEMSDFYELSANEMCCNIKRQGLEEKMTAIPLVDVGILNEVVSMGKALLTENIQLIPDYDSIPLAIREKLLSGEYSLGSSKQVEGNLRAVIVDSSGTRVKDLTFKQVSAEANIVQNVSNLTLQLQMRQIYQGLIEIQEGMKYLIKKQRDDNIYRPFLNARDNIYKAQTTSDMHKRTELLVKAVDILTDAKNSVALDIRTLSEFICTKKMRRKNYALYLAEDIFILTKIVGIHLYISDFLGEGEECSNLMEWYKQQMLPLCKRSIKGNAPLMMLQELYPYTQSNRDIWFDFRVALEQQFSAKTIKCEKSYLLLMED